MFFFSCSKSDDQETSTTNVQTNLSNPLTERYTGISFDNYYLLHNPALDVFYNDVKNNQSIYFGNGTSQSKEDRAYMTVTNYLRSEVSTSIDSSWLDTFFANAKNADYSNNVDFLRVTNSKYYTQLLNTINNNTSIATVHSQLNSLILTLQNDSSVSDFDKIALKSAMLIGDQSFEYWTNEDTKWDQLGKSSPFAKPPKKNKKDIMKADVEGAVGGAITGAFTGAPFAGAGAGVGALLGGMLGAAWGSAVNGAFQHFGIWD